MSFPTQANQPTEYTAVVRLADCYIATHIKGQKKLSFLKIHN